MAAALLRRAAQNDGAPDLDIDSAGLHPTDPCATAGAVTAMLAYGIDLSDHRPKAVSQDLVDWAELVLTVSHDHSRTVVQRFPGASGKTAVFSSFAGDEGDIPDPYGAGLLAFESCARRLCTLAQQALARLRP